MVVSADAGNDSLVHRCGHGDRRTQGTDACRRRGHDPRARDRGIATAVVEVGDGPPLLLLHGGIECGGAMWAPVLAQLAETHRVVVPDVPGLGESAPAPRLDVDTFTGWLQGVVSQTGLERPTLVAHSLVGSLAARFAAGGTDLIGRLVVLRSASRRPVPNATTPALRRCPFRDPSDAAQRRTIRSLRPSRRRRHAAT